MTAADLKAVGAMAALLKDALKPNLIQTLEHTPAIWSTADLLPTSPTAVTSVRATKTALKLADYTITEAGFGADLGAEKFFDIKCRMAGLKPDAVVLVATVRALKYNGGVAKGPDLSAENLDALKKGIVNLEKHIENLQQFGVPVVVTLNSFLTDTEAETSFVQQFCEERGCEFALSEVWAQGRRGRHRACGEGSKDPGKKRKPFCSAVRREIFRIKEKIETALRQEIYGADCCFLSPQRHPDRSGSSKRWALEIFRSAWQRPSIPCRMTQSC